MSSIAGLAHFAGVDWRPLRRCPISLTSSRFAEIFCAVVERGSYSAAARQLGLTPAAVSRAVARRERALEVRLFERTTRDMTPTESGLLYYERCRRALELFEEADRTVVLQGREPRGSVRLSAPTTYGHARLLPVLAEFANRYPRVRLEVNLSNDNVDLVRDGYQLAVRRGELSDSSLVVRKLEDARAGVFVSPAHLARQPAPEHPDALLQRACLPFVQPRTGRVIDWEFVDRSGRALRLTPPDRVRCSGDPLGCIGLAVAGAGYVQTYGFLVEHHVRQGRLVEVLRAFAGRSSPFSLVRPARRGESLAVRRLAQSIVDHCARATNRLEVVRGDLTL